jgi:hypothetical protein
LPLASVVPEVGLTVPHVAAGVATDGVTLNVTRSFGTAAPPAVVVTVAVNATVSVPFALMFAGVGTGARATVFACAGLVVWSSVFELLPPVLASVAVTLQNPIVPDAVYVTLAAPLAFVVAVAALSEPHAPAGLPLRLKVTTSVATPALAPVPALTWAVTVRVDTLSAGTVVVGTGGVAVVAKDTPTVFKTRVSVIVTDPVRPLLASVAVMVHVPAVLEEV